MEIAYTMKKIRSPIELGRKEDLSFLSIIENGLEALKNGDFGAHVSNEFLGACLVIEELDFPKFSAIKKKIKESGASMLDFNRAFKKLKEKNTNIIKYNAEINQNERSEIPEIIRQSPNPDVDVPPQYRVSDLGVFRISIDEDGHEHKHQIANNPMILTKSILNMENKNEVVGIAFKKGENWREFEVDRDRIANTRKIIDLSILGAPITSNNAANMVEYLTLFEAFNEIKLPTLLTSCKLGWLGKDPNKSFLLSNHLIQAAGQETNEIKFRAISEGESKFAESIMEKGSIEEWSKLIESCKHFPKVMFVLYTSFAAVMLPLLGTPNFVVELFGRTSRGKTTALKVAASVWGSPDESGDNSFLGTWDATKVQIERNLSMLSGIPLILDDTKRVKNKNNISDVIYMVGSGQGRARGNLTGFNSAKKFKTILMSSGETACTRFTQDAGAKARILEVGGLPFKEDDTKMAIFVKKLEQGLKENYGFAGPQFVKYVLNNQDLWKDWKASKNEIEMELMEKNSSPVAGRLASYFATIISTAWIVNQAIPEIFIFPSSLNSLWDGIVDNADDANSEKAALQHVMSWAYANAESFKGRERVDRIPVLGWAGRWDGDDLWNQIYFSTNCMKKILSDGGFNYDEILSHWKDSGVIDVSTKSSRGYTKQMKILGENQWLICINRSAVDIMDEDSN